MADRIDRGNRRTAQVASGLTVLVAAWLWVSPWVLTYDGNAGWNSTIAAAVIAVLTLVRVFGDDRSAWVSWVTVVLGAWLVVAPWFVTGYTDTARINSVIVGIVVALLALWSALSASRPTTPAEP